VFSIRNNEGKTIAIARSLKLFPNLSVPEGQVCRRPLGLALLGSSNISLEQSPPMASTELLTNAIEVQCKSRINLPISELRSAISNVGSDDPTGMIVLDEICDGQDLLVQERHRIVPGR
jgi:hypothetical protein